MGKRWWQLSCRKPQKDLHEEEELTPVVQNDIKEEVKQITSTKFLTPRRASESGIAFSPPPETPTLFSYSSLVPGSEAEIRSLNNSAEDDGKGERKEKQFTSTKFLTPMGESEKGMSKDTSLSCTDLVQVSLEIKSFSPKTEEVTNSDKLESDLNLTIADHSSSTFAQTPKKTMFTSVSCNNLGQACEPKSSEIFPFHSARGSPETPRRYPGVEVSLRRRLLSNTAEDGENSDKVESNLDFKKVDPFSSAVVRSAISVFRQSAEMGQLKRRLEDLNQEVQKQSDVLRATASILASRTSTLERETVRRCEVSESIRANPYLEWREEQKKKIKADTLLQAYCDAFRSYFDIAFTSAQSVVDGKLALNTSGLLEQALNVSLSCIPFCGNTLSEILDIGLDMYRSAHIQGNAKLFLKIASTADDMRKIIDKVAYDITLHETKINHIHLLQDKHKPQGLLSQFIEKCKQIKSAVNNVLEGGELYETEYAKLAIQDAIMAIAAFLNHAPKIQGFEDASIVEKILKNAILPNVVWDERPCSTALIESFSVVEIYYGPVDTNTTMTGDTIETLI